MKHLLYCKGRDRCEMNDEAIASQWRTEKELNREVKVVCWSSATRQVSDGWIRHIGEGGNVEFDSTADWHRKPVFEAFDASLHDSFVENTKYNETRVKVERLDGRVGTGNEAMNEMGGIKIKMGEKKEKKEKNNKIRVIFGAWMGDTKTGERSKEQEEDEEREEERKGGGSEGQRLLVQKASLVLFFNHYRVLNRHLGLFHKSVLRLFSSLLLS